MDFFKFILCLDKIEIACVVSGPCPWRIFESLRIQMLWETWDSFRPLREKLPHSSCPGMAGPNLLRRPKPHLFIICSLKAGRRKGDGKTTTPGKTQCLRRGKICLMALSPGENHVFRGEKESTKSNSLGQNYSLHTTQGDHARI